MEETISFSECNEGLKCPHCGEANLHCREVEIGFRWGENEPGFVTTVNSSGASTIDVNDSAIYGRYNAIAIAFDCKNCPDISYLIIQQHKDTILIEWSETKMLRKKNFNFNYKLHPTIAWEKIKVIHTHLEELEGMLSSLAGKSNSESRSDLR